MKRPKITKMEFITPMVLLLLIGAVAYVAIKPKFGRSTISYYVKDKSDVRRITRSVWPMLIDYKEISDAELSVLLESDEIFELDAAYCASVTDLGVTGLANHRRLISLNLRGTSVTGHGEGFDGLSRSLTELDLSNTKTNTLDFLSPLHDRLRELNVSRCPIPSRAVGYLSYLPALRELNIAGCVGIMPEDMSLLRAAPTLEVLSIDHSQASADVLRMLGQSSVLKEVRVECENDTQAQDIAAMGADTPNLKVVPTKRTRSHCVVVEPTRE